MTIVEFLESRLAEDEAEAHRWYADAGGGDWDELEHRVLADVEAKRAIIAAWTDENSIPEYKDREWSYAQGIDLAVRHLAAVYAGHPDYQQEWRP